jgi:hypothetical protein
MPGSFIGADSRAVEAEEVKERCEPYDPEPRHAQSQQQRILLSSQGGLNVAQTFLTS